MATGANVKVTIGTATAEFTDDGSGNMTPYFELRHGKICSKRCSKNITLSPHGTGNRSVDTAAKDATVQSDGNHNLVLHRRVMLQLDHITITDGANGDIEIIMLQTELES